MNRVWLGCLGVAMFAGSIACRSAPAPAAVAGPTVSGLPAGSAPCAGPGACSAHVAATGPRVWKLAELGKGAVLLEGLGSWHRAVTTHSALAQAFFDQGLALTYGFNHDEAARSFARAVELDPSCALCYWGVALTLGPNYNAPMFAERSAAAWEALSAAKAASHAATSEEQALIAALAKRYKGPDYLDEVAMKPFNLAYADGMREVAQRFAHDADVQALFAAALMDTNPWQLWTVDGEPEVHTLELVATLEAVLAEFPQHAGANHYYIHAVEASRTPGRAAVAADRLPALMPGAGHVMHMPAHIYQRVGRYADASEANRRAIIADEAYLARVVPLGHYAFYLGHNQGFLAYSAAMQGRAEEALSAARKSADATPRTVLCRMPGIDFFLAAPLFVQVRFGRWSELLAVPKPADKYPVLLALYEHARGMALAATGRHDEALAAAHAIHDIATKIPDDLLTGLNSGKRVLELAALAVEARAAEVAHEPDAITRWQAVVALEDKLAYNEPADWFYPTRHYLGAALLDLGRAGEAEAVFRADLERNPHNGWALFGLAQALGAQHKTRERSAVTHEFENAWKDSDIKLERSAF